MRSLKVCGWVWASRCHWPGRLDLEDGQRLASADEAHRRLIGRVEDEVIDIGPRRRSSPRSGSEHSSTAPSVRRPSRSNLIRPSRSTSSLSISNARTPLAEMRTGRMRGQRLAREHHAAVVQREMARQADQPWRDLQQALQPALAAVTDLASAAVVVGKVAIELLQLVLVRRATLVRSP